MTENTIETISNYNLQQRPGILQIFCGSRCTNDMFLVKNIYGCLMTMSQIEITITNYKFALCWSEKIQSSTYFYNPSIVEPAKKYILMNCLN